MRLCLLEYDPDTQACSRAINTAHVILIISLLIMGEFEKSISVARITRVSRVF